MRLALGICLGFTLGALGLAAFRLSQSALRAGGSVGGPGGPVGLVNGPTTALRSANVPLTEEGKVRGARGVAGTPLGRDLREPRPRR